MKKCKCGAKWRINYPYGKKNKSIKTFEKEHSKDCKNKHNK